MSSSQLTDYVVFFQRGRSSTNQLLNIIEDFQLPFWIPEDWKQIEHALSPWYPESDQTKFLTLRGIQVQRHEAFALLDGCSDKQVCTNCGYATHMSCAFQGLTLEGFCFWRPLKYVQDTCSKGYEFHPSGKHTIFYCQFNGGTSWYPATQHEITGPSPVTGSSTLAWLSCLKWLCLIK